MEQYFRIHGDNIVECERIANIIINETNPEHINISLVSPSTISMEICFSRFHRWYRWYIDLLPGFNKSGRRRWRGDIFSALRENGSFLDETPDAIITEVVSDTETIICAIEFCSALQAGNQAWQRSGRAFSTGRTGCPYLYIVDFVKYELDPSTRERKALRFPNPAVPYSYINFSRTTGNFVAQIYVRSEEFDKSHDATLAGFDENDFGDQELACYIVDAMAGIDTAELESIILQKNLNVVMFLASTSNTRTNFSWEQWQQLYESGADIVSYAKENSGFIFHKKITAKGHHGKSASMLDLIDDHSVGLASRDLPFGIIPAERRSSFARGLRRLYPSFDRNTIARIANGRTDLILCLIKGFKPGGDDNRPDRGILPLAAMLSNTQIEVMTYIYGPVLAYNFDLLNNDPLRLASANGLWKSILSLSNYVALDVPILRGRYSDAEVLIDTTNLKEHYIYADQAGSLEGPVFPSAPQEYHEDDVDTGIHFTFYHLLRNYCFEGMCNPPGGDWSGFSIISGNYERRWLSLPRVSGDVDGKRPDHILELFGVFDIPVLLSIESKENSADLEPDVGTGLKNYIYSLLEYVPNVERRISPAPSEWCKAETFENADDYIMVSAAAYLKNTAQRNGTVFAHSNCDMLFIMDPKPQGWEIEIVVNSPKASALKGFIIDKIAESGSSQVIIV